MGEQDAVVRALADPGFYPHRPARVDHVQTHISHVFLAGPFVYKLKKPVRFPFLDFSTPERRAHFCAEELRLNRRLCPDVYLDVLRVTRGPDGGLALGGSGHTVEHLLHMRRLPADRVLARLLAARAVAADRLDALAALLARFHARAPGGPEVAAFAAPEALVARWEENLAGVPAVGTLLPAEDHEILRDFGPTFVRRHETVLRARCAGGYVREGHGDLHAEHVYFLDSAVPGPRDLPPLAPGIYVVDCVEFSRPFRCNDVASEIAFLAMDLERLERPDLARRFVAAYAAAARDPGVESLLPFYVCQRACVRGKVEGLASLDPEVEPAAREAAAERARTAFGVALRHAWGAEGPAVIACAGLSGSGKTTLARAIASATGFERIGTDPIRRRASAARYTSEARDAVYETLFAEAAAALAAGRSIVADATFGRRRHRERLAAVARAERRPWVFVECRASEDVVRERLAGRATSAGESDADWHVYLAQREAFEPFRADEPHLTVDADGPHAAVRGAACRLLWAWRQGRPLPAA